jgi:citrate synthase
MASSCVTHLKERIRASAKPLQEKVGKMKTDSTVIQQITVEQAINGMRGINGMLTQTSDLSAMDGIKYRGIPLRDACKILPRAKGGEEPLPEGALWLLLTGEVPKADVVEAVTKELHSREDIPAHVIAVLDSLPKTMHPMTQLSIGLLALQPTSKFADAYSKGTMKKGDYWEFVLDDALTLLAQIPMLAARIYRRTFHDGKVPASRKDLDWAGNFAHMLGVSNDEKFKEAIRLYLTLHADHEGGNVSGHTTHVVASALSDPYYSWAAGNCGLAGPLHGLANQECLSWLNNTMKELNGKEPTVEVISDFAKKTLADGKVIPGFGHAVLRNTDPRYTLEHDFALKNLPNDPTFKLADSCLKAIPPVLKASGKAKNPFPNVDALSGTILKYYGLTEPDYYTVVFSVSRAMGCMSQMVWSRLFGIPIERPNSVTVEFLEEAIAAAPKSKL